MIVYCDANPRMCAVVSEDGITQVEKFAEKRTVNEAEYLAVIKALGLHPGVTEIRTDSQLVVEQLNHRWHIKEDRLRVLAQEIWDMRRDVTFTWVPRKENLAGKALR